MPRRSHLSIPHQLQQLKAQEIYEQRIDQGKNVSPQGDWETARRYLNRYPQVVRAWKRNQAIAFCQQLPKAFFRRLWRSLKAVIIVIGKIITFPFWLFYKLPQLFANTDTRPFALDVVKTLISAASLIAAIIAAIGLFFNILDARHDREDARQNRQLTQERLITDRFTKSVAQIGNDKEEVVIGGIYSLERIAKDSPKDQWTIMEVLTAFVRKNSEKDLKPLPLNEVNSVKRQVQAALTVIGRRDPEQDYGSDENHKVNRKRLDLSHINLVKAYLFDANLRSSYLHHSNLRGAYFRSANLRGANLFGAYFYGGNLKSADLRGANLTKTDLKMAFLDGANLKNANLSGAKNLTNKQIKSACFWEEAIYSDAEWDDLEEQWILKDQIANQKRIEEIKKDKTSNPANPPDCKR